MIKFVTLFAAGLAFAAAPAFSQDETTADRIADAASDGLIVSADDVTLEELRWISRPLVVFADSPADPQYIQQMENIRDRRESLITRDVLVVTDTDPATRSSFRQSLRPRQFMVVVMGKDGTVVLRRPVPLSVREISRSIDKIPLRRQEMRDASRATN